MNKQYVEYKDDVYRVEGTRISLDSVVYAFLNGETAESIAQAFPVLTLEQVYGAITYYLANRATIDEYLEKAKADYKAMWQASRESNPMFYQKLSKAKQQMRQTINDTFSS